MALLTADAISADTLTVDKLTDMLKVNYGLKVMQPQSYAGIKLVVSDQVPDDKAYVVGDQTLVSAKMFNALKTAAANLGATADEATDAFKRFGSVMSKRLDDQIYGALAGTALDTHPEQTEMERSALWGQF